MNMKFQREFILECPNDDEKRIVSVLIRRAFRSNFHFERDFFVPQEKDISSDISYEDSMDIEGSPKSKSNHHAANTLTARFLDFNLKMISLLKPYYRTANSHFQNIYSFVKVHPSIGEYLLENSIIFKCYFFILDETEEEQPQTPNSENVLEIEEKCHRLVESYRPRGYRQDDYTQDKLLEANLPYMWAMLAYLVRRASDQAKGRRDQISYTIGESQKSVMLGEGKDFIRLLGAATSQSMPIMLRLYADLSYNDIATTKMLLRILDDLIRESSDSDFKFINTWIGLARALIKVNDEFVVTRVMTLA